MKVNKSQGYKIQLLRGLAIIAVVFIHNAPNGMTQVWWRPFLNFSVGTFLFLSGMLSDVNKWNPKRRITKVMIPYLIWSLLYIILIYMQTPSQIPIMYLKTLFTAGSAAIMYYVFIYSELTLLIPLIDKLARSKYKCLGFVISPLEVILMRFLPLMTGYQMNRYISIIMGISCLSWFSYYYLGYLLGNNIIKIKSSSKKLLILWIISIVIQILEGYGYYLKGEINCGTQLKLSSLLSGALFVMLAFKFIKSKKEFKFKPLFILGNYSFGIYFSHLAVMNLLNRVPYYSKYIGYPFNAIITVGLTFIFVFIGRKILGKYSKYLAL